MPGCDFRGTQRYPAFGQLPPSVDPQSEFALARVIDRQDDQNLVLVAEADGKMVGHANSVVTRNILTLGNELSLPMCGDCIRLGCWSAPQKLKYRLCIGLLT